MKHKQKVKMARKMSGLMTRHFLSSIWENHVNRIKYRIFKTESRQKELAKKRKENINRKDGDTK